MVQLGYALSSEEHHPNDLVRNARRAEEAGFTFALISDHFHPWVDAQGHSPFVWSVIGGIAQATRHLKLGTGVTCPTMRIHPAIIAQAAATSAAMMGDRFFLGVGTGENLNEHIFGEHWPPFDVRADMLEEAVEVIRMLWEGDETSYYGAFYTVEEARIYTLPENPIPIVMAAGGPKSAELAGYIADGLISTSPDAELLQAFRENNDGPCYGKLTVCWAEDMEQGRATAHKLWAFSALPGQLGQELRGPDLFEQAVEAIKPEDMDRTLLLGNDVEQHRQKIQEFIAADFDHVYIHQVGPDQEGFIRFYEREILPAFR